jgi:hypothetical protein
MILSCNSTNPSICGVALSWKYNPQGLGASQILNIFKYNKVSIYIFLFFFSITKFIETNKQFIL